MENARFIDIESESDLEKVFRDSFEKPALLFKHSETCGISRSVIRSVSTLDSDIYLVTVQRSRGISDEIAERTGIRHASPQALVVKNGECVFHASHYDIQAAEIMRQL